SSVAGRVALSWDITTDMLTVKWVESGGPPTKPPAKSNFGTRIITGSIERQLGGKTEFDWRQEGLSCLFLIPRVKEFSNRAANGNGAAAKQRPAGETELVITGNRIMVVEDEVLVAMVVSEYLEDMGYTVVGPYGRLAEAITALKSKSVEAAVLDINLAGELVY